MIALTEPMEFYKTFLEWYINQVKAESYLEVGCADGGLVYRLRNNCPSLKRAVGIDVQDRKWIDADGAEFFVMSSDDYFSQDADKYDVILIDGDHSSSQAYRDAINALGVLNPSGLILMHDTYPPDKDHTGQKLCGDAWRVPDNLKHSPLFEVFTFPVTFGLTLVRKVEARPWL